jgi:hypothetical protein
MKRIVLKLMFHGWESKDLQKRLVEILRSCQFVEHSQKRLENPCYEEDHDWPYIGFLQLQLQLSLEMEEMLCVQYGKICSL